MQQLTYTVPPEFDGEPLQNFLRRGCGMSWRMVVKLKRVERGMTADGCPMRTIDRVRKGQTVVLCMPEDTVKIEPIELPLDVVYEDDALLVINKPPYLAVHPSAGLPGPTLANAVVSHFDKAGQALSFRPLNRLDKNTSGLLLAAKNAHAAHALAGQAHKEYLALALGNMEGSGTVDQPIRVKEGCCITREVGEGGKPSITHWQALASTDDATLLRLWLETGRTHQIRVHMAWLGHPLAGDTMYGTDQAVMIRHGLHCARMTLRHPMTGETLAFSARPPEDMLHSLRAIPGAAEQIETYFNRDTSAYGNICI